VVTFLFIQKLVENVRRRRTSGNQRQNGSRQAVFQPASGRTLAFFLMAEIYLTISVED